MVWAANHEPGAGGAYKCLNFGSRFALDVPPKTWMGIGVCEWLLVVVFLHGHEVKVLMGLRLLARRQRVVDDVSQGGQNIAWLGQE